LPALPCHQRVKRLEVANEFRLEGVLVVRGGVCGRAWIGAHVWAEKLREMQSRLKAARQTIRSR
jgi:hypothetical protein